MFKMDFTIILEISNFHLDLINFESKFSNTVSLQQLGKCKNTNATKRSSGSQIMSSNQSWQSQSSQGQCPVKGHFVMPRP